MPDALSQTKVYGNSRISGKARATLGDTYTYNYNYNYNYYLGTRFSTPTEHTNLQLSGSSQNLYSAQSRVVFRETAALRPSSLTG